MVLWNCEVGVLYGLATIARIVVFCKQKELFCAVVPTASWDGAVTYTFWECYRFLVVDITLLSIKGSLMHMLEVNVSVCAWPYLWFCGSAYVDSGRLDTWRQVEAVATQNRCTLFRLYIAPGTVHRGVYKTTSEIRTLFLLSRIPYRPILGILSKLAYYMYVLHLSY